MKATEANELASRCADYNDERNYDYVMFKIIQRCSDGKYGLILYAVEVFDITLKRLVSEGYRYRIYDVESTNIIKLEW